MDYNILSLAREEYTEKLCNTLRPLIYDGLKAIWDDVKKSSNERCLLRFQQQLSLVPKWNKDIIDNECSRISKEISISQLEKIVEAVFIFNIKILSSIGNGDNIHLTIPEIKHFIHKCYINCARDFYTNPYIIDDRLRNNIYDNLKVQKNYRDSLNLISNSIEKTIKECIPIEQILEQYLNSQNDNEDARSVMSNVSENENEHESDMPSQDETEIGMANENGENENGENEGGDSSEQPNVPDSEYSPTENPQLLTTSGSDITNAELNVEQNIDENQIKTYEEYPPPQEPKEHGIFDTINLSNNGNNKANERQNQESENFFD